MTSIQLLPFADPINEETPILGRPVLGAVIDDYTYVPEEENNGSPDCRNGDPVVSRELCSVCGNFRRKDDFQTSRQGQLDFQRIQPKFTRPQRHLVRRPR